MDQIVSHPKVQCDPNEESKSNNFSTQIKIRSNEIVESSEKKTSDLSLNERDGKRILSFDEQKIEETVEQNVENPDDLTLGGIIKRLLPGIQDCVREGKFDAEFVRTLSEGVKNASAGKDIDDGYSRIVQWSFERLLIGNGLEVFNTIVGQYLVCLDSATTPEERERIQDDLEAFIYNTFVPPYQLWGEGSCFVTAILIKLWHDDSVKYLKLIDRVIGEDIADLRIIKENFEEEVAPQYVEDLSEIDLKKLMNLKNAGEDIDPKDINLVDTKDYGKNDDKYTRPVQKLTSVLAWFSFQGIDGVQEELLSRFVDGCKVIGEQAAAILGIKFVNGLRVWDHGWIPACFFCKAMESNIELIDRLAGEFISAVLQVLHDHPDIEFIEPTNEKGEIFDNPLDALKMVIERVYKNFEKRPDGGFTESIIDNIWGASAQEKISLQLTGDASTLSFNDAQKLLNILEYGSVSPSEGKKLQDGQCMVVSCFNLEDGHVFICIAGHHDIKNMRPGDQVLIGHMNFTDYAQQNLASVYLKKFNEDKYQLAWFNGLPIMEHMTVLNFYSNFMVNSISF